MSFIHEAFKKLVGVSIVFDGVDYPNNYADDLAIDKSNLEQEFVEHAERYAYYATLAEIAEERQYRLKEELENISARLYLEVRMASDRIKQTDAKFKMSETTIDSEVRMKPEYQQKLKEVQQARYLAKILKNASFVFANRKEMLVTLGMTHGAGMSNPRVAEVRESQVRGMFVDRYQSAKTAVLEAPELPEIPDDIDATSMLSEHVEIVEGPLDAPIPSAPVTPSGRRRPSKNV